MRQTLDAGASYRTEFHEMLVAPPMKWIMLPLLKRKIPPISFSAAGGIGAWITDILDPLDPYSFFFGGGSTLREAAPYWTNAI